jgi:hypothetical protein
MVGVVLSGHAVVALVALVPEIGHAVVALLLALIDQVAQALFPPFTSSFIRSLDRVNRSTLGKSDYSLRREVGRLSPYFYAIYRHRRGRYPT